MPDFAPGKLLGSSRYRVLQREGQDIFHHHRGEAQFAGLPASQDPEEQILVQCKSIRYEMASPIPGETLPQYVDRRRAELQREAEYLACYHEITAHVPQVLDLISGRNELDPHLASCGRQDGELCLVTERLLANPLSQVREPLSQEEVLIIAEKILMLLRVFHSSSAATGERRYFVTLTPNDLLVDRHSFDCWFTSLWKLQTQRELQGRPIPCVPEARAFVSPAIAWRLQPAPAKQRAIPGVKPDDLDLYSVGVILYFLLKGAPDLSGEPSGFLDKARVDQLRLERQLRPEVAEFLGKLAGHEFHMTQQALDALCDLRHRPRYSSFTAPTRPVKYVSGSAANQYLAANTLHGKRYEVLNLISVGGQGCVYLGRDQHTNSLVVLKMLLYPENQQGQRTLEEYAVFRREECLREARLALRVHNRVSTVPQLLDVVRTIPSDERLRTHADPKISGEHEPLLVFEYIAGRPLDPTQNCTEIDALEFLLATSKFLLGLHLEKNGLYYLYVDWKPENIVRHGESGNFTIVDLGAIVHIHRGVGDYETLYSTNPYCAPEEFVQGKINQHLTPAYDLYGLGAVTWDLVAQVKREEIEELANKTYAMYKSGAPMSPMLRVDRVPVSFAQLRPILDKCLRVKPDDRYQSAAELAQAALAALGKLNRFPPDAIRSIAGTLHAGGQIKMKCQLSLDRFCEKVVICRGVKPPQSPTDGVVREELTAKCQLGGDVTWSDSVDITWTQVHYAAFSIGFNGNVSSPARCSVQMAVPPVVKPIVEQEESLVIKWEVPETVRLNGGRIVVDRLSPSPATVYEGLDEHIIDTPLAGEQKARYRLISRYPFGDSQSVEIEGTPFPKFAHFESIDAVAGDSRITVLWVMPCDAVNEIVLVRSQTPLGPDELNQRHKRARFEPIRFRLDKNHKVVGVEPKQNVRFMMLQGSKCQVEWTDSTVVPGIQYYYTPLLYYRRLPEPWSEQYVHAKAFVEVRGLNSTAFPGAVRLEWEASQRADETIVERLEQDHVAQTWTLPSASAALVDRELMPGAKVRHRVRLRFDKSISAGREITTEVGKDTPQFPPLLVMPGNHNVSVACCGLQDGEPLLLEATYDDKSQRFEMPPGTNGMSRNITVPLVPWVPASFSLLNAEGKKLQEVQTMAYEEVSHARALIKDGVLEVTWIPPKGCRKVLIGIPGTGFQRMTPAQRGRTQITPVPDQGSNVIIRAITTYGDISTGVVVAIEGPKEVLVEETTGEGST